MEAVLLKSAWGWSEVLAPALRGSPYRATSRRTGWRSHRLRAQSIAHTMCPRLWSEAEVHEPSLLAWLSSLIGREREKVCESRLEYGSPGLRADAACDLTWLAWEAGKVTTARTWATRALEILPQHREALRWLQLLRSSSPLSALKSPDRLDHIALCPRPQQGWLSSERWRRRGLSGRWTRPANLTSALFALQDRGVHTRCLAPDSWWQAQPRDHPAIELESRVDEIFSQIRSLRCAAQPAWHAWDLASRIGPGWVAALARLLARIAIDEPSLSRIGLLASAVACRLHPNSPIWHGHRARLLAETGRETEALCLARSLLDSPCATEVHRQAIQTLVRCGYRREAARATRATRLFTVPKCSSHRPRRCIDR